MNQNGMPQSFSGQPKINKGKPIAIIVLFVLVLLCTGALAIINYFPEVVLKPKMIYLLSEKQGVQLLEKQVEEYSNDGFIKDSMKIFETPFKNDSELSVNINVDKLNVPTVAQYKPIINVINTLKIKSAAAADYKADKSTSEIALSLGGNDFIKAALFLDQKKLGVSVPVLYDKYLTINGDDLETVYKKFGQTPEIKRIVTNSDMMKVIKFDKKLSYQLLNNYAIFFTGLLKNENFKFEKGVELLTTEGKIKGNKVTLHLTQAEAKEIYIKMLEKVSNDDKLLDMTAGNIINVAKLYEEAGYYGKAGLPVGLKDINAVKEEIRKNIEELKNNTSGFQGENEYTMALLVDNKFKILERTIQVSAKDSEKNSLGTGTLRLAGYNMPKTKSKANVVEVIFEQQNMKSSWILNSIKEPFVQGKTRNIDITLDLVLAANGQENKPFTCKIDAEENTVKDKTRDIKANYEIAVVYPMLSDPLRINGILNSNMARNPGKNTFDSVFDLSGNFIFPAVNGQAIGEIGIGFNQKQNYVFGTPVVLPKLNESNSIDINTATPDQIKEIATQVEASIKKFIGENASLFMPKSL